MTDKRLEDMTVPELTQRYNSISGRQIKKFKSKADALRRIAELGDGGGEAPDGVSPPSTNSIAEQFGFRGKHRKELLDKLVAKFGRQVSRKDLGPQLVAAISGLEWRINGKPGADGRATVDELPYKLIKGEDGSYGLYNDKR